MIVRELIEVLQSYDENLVVDIMDTHEEQIRPVIGAFEYYPYSNRDNGYRICIDGAGFLPKDMGPCHGR